MNMLAIDTSSQILGVALMKNNQIAAELTTYLKKDHSSRLMPAINQVMQQIDMKPEDIHKIAVAYAPGSYTGTRIGVTTAKTLAWALDIPVVPISSLKILGYNAVPYAGYISPFLDARRGAVFTGLYRFSKGKLDVIQPDRYLLMVEWLRGLNELNRPVFFLRTHFEKHETRIYESGIATIHAPNTNHLLRPSNLLTHSETAPTIHAHEVVPTYYRVAAA